MNVSSVQKILGTHLKALYHLHCTLLHLYCTKHFTCTLPEYICKGLRKLGVNMVCEGNNDELKIFNQ